VGSALHILSAHAAMLLRGKTSGGRKIEFHGCGWSGAYEWHSCIRIISLLVLVACSPVSFSKQQVRRSEPLQFHSTIAQWPDTANSLFLFSLPARLLFLANFFQW